MFSFSRFFFYTFSFLFSGGVLPSVSREMPPPCVQDCIKTYESFACDPQPLASNTQGSTMRFQNFNEDWSEMLGLGCFRLQFFLADGLPPIMTAMSCASVVRCLTAFGYFTYSRCASPFILFTASWILLPIVPGRHYGLILTSNQIARMAHLCHTSKKIERVQCVQKENRKRDATDMIKKRITVLDPLLK